MRLGRSISARLPVTGNQGNPSLSQSPLPGTLSHSCNEHLVTPSSGGLFPGGRPPRLSFCLLPSAGPSCGSGHPCCRDSLTFTVPGPPREGPLIRPWAFPTHTPIWGWRHCQTALPSSSALPAVCYRADREKWQFSSFPAKRFRADSASFNATTVQWRKGGERPRIEEQVLINRFEVLLWGFPFTQKSPCHPFQGQIAAQERSPLRTIPSFIWLISLSRALFCWKDTIVSHAPAMGMLGVKTSWQRRNRVFHHRTEPWPWVSHFPCLDLKSSLQSKNQSSSSGWYTLQAMKHWKKANCMEFSVFKSPINLYCRISPHTSRRAGWPNRACDAWKTLWGELCSGGDFVLRLLSGWGQRRGLIPALLLLALCHFWRSHHPGTPPATAQTPFPALVSQTQPSRNNPYFFNPFQVTPIHLKMRMFLLCSPPL